MRRRAGGGLTNKFTATPATASASHKFDSPTRPLDKAVNIEPFSNPSAGYGHVYTRKDILADDARLHHVSSPSAEAVSVGQHITAAAARRSAAPVGPDAETTPLAKVGAVSSPTAPLMAHSYRGPTPRKPQVRPQEAEVQASTRVNAEQALAALTESGAVRRAAQAFYALDMDGDGSLTGAELQAGLLRQRLLLDDREVARLMRMVDDDASGRIDIAEFLRHCHSHGGWGAPGVSLLRDPPPGYRETTPSERHRPVRVGEVAPAAAPAAAAAAAANAVAAFPALATSVLPASAAEMRRLFLRLDADQDGAVAAADVAAALRRGIASVSAPTAELLPSPPGSAGSAAGAGDAHPPLTHGSHSEGSSDLDLVAQLVKAADANGDGYLTAADLVALERTVRATAVPPQLVGNRRKLHSAAAGGAGADERDTGDRLEVTLPSEGAAFFAAAASPLMATASARVKAPVPRHYRPRPTAPAYADTGTEAEMSPAAEPLSETGYRVRYGFDPRQSDAWAGASAERARASLLFRVGLDETELEPSGAARRTGVEDASLATAMEGTSGRGGDAVLLPEVRESTAAHAPAAGKPSRPGFAAVAGFGPPMSPLGVPLLPGMQRTTRAGMSSGGGSSGRPRHSVRRAASSAADGEDEDEASQPLPFWMQDTSDVLQPAPGAPAFASDAERLVRKSVVGAVR